jgi:predicted HAD superfamily Cof-like phosphohydrolase
MNNQDLVREFYEAKAGSMPSRGEATRYFDEEITELDNAIDLWYSSEHGPAKYKNPDAILSLAKEMADVVYTLYGLAIAFGIDLDRAFARVHESNMTKEPTHEGKVRKGDGYAPPDLRDCLL